MKILGNTPDGDLIIQVSQAEWDGLQDGVRPKEKTWLEFWDKTEASKFLPKNLRSYLTIKRAFKDNKIDGSIQSLQDVANGEIRVNGIGPVIQAKLKTLLNEQT